MADILRIKRRAIPGATGAPASLASAEIAYNENDDVLYYGKGDSGGMATSIVPIGGSGAFPVGSFLPLAGGTLTGALTLPVGTAAAPALMMGDTNSGLVGGANSVGITTDGVQRLTVSTAEVASTLNFRAPVGAVAAPSFTFFGDTDTGMWHPANEIIAISTAGVERTRISSSGFVSNVDLTVNDATPSININNTGATAGMVLNFVRTNLARWVIEASGDPESTGNVGSNLRVRRFDDAGAPIEYLLHGERSTGVFTVGGNGPGGALSERMLVTSLNGSAADTPVLRVNNNTTAAPASVDIVLSTGAAAGGRRAILRGHRQGSNGDLSLITTLGTAEVVNQKLTSNGQTAFATGSAATPAITFAGDTNTGIYSIGADEIDFTTGGVHRMGLAATGLWVNTAVVATGDVRANDIHAIRAAAPTTGALYFGNADNYLYYDGNNFNLTKPLNIGGTNPSVNMGGSQIWVGSGHFFLQARSDYRCYWDGSTGGWYWQRGAWTTDMQLNPGGDLYIGGSLNGTASNGGLIRTEDNAHSVNFYYVLSGAFHNIGWRLDRGGAIGLIATQTNCNNLGYAGGTGGPTAVSLNGYDGGGTLFGIYADAVSDERIKENIRDTEVDALAVLAALPVHAFDIKAPVAAHIAGIGKTDEEKATLRANAMPASVAIGFIAQEVKALIPEAVSITQQPEGSVLPADTHNLIQQNMVPYLWRAVQQQQDLIKALEARLAALEGATP